MTALAEILSRPGSTIDEVERLFDGMSFPAVLARTRELLGKDLARLYALAAGRSIGVDHLVPDSLPDLAPVRHHGTNSLPFFRTFEKRFLRAPRAEFPGGRLWGYNHQALAWLTGPGYFVVDPPPPGEELAIDYYQIPERRPLDSWPRLRGNEGLVSRFVYGFMKDFMRRVSRTVSIGQAARHGKRLETYFILVREE